ncbi:putative L-ascorbate peroxidase 6 isoform X1 [Ananas comosus]|uniref:L-ascorbate peroxidase n=1 Tax=Ananas comosus TaxID=4615 RepID=A0A6P5FY93_ANACO|nr:putative L-ascorbate peroxidase 6 isoform X1 [Ananas comosus]XP_020101000.1 putative L-ascorbate peroxidase 6 isoform X1 [Ananas comosus]
MAPPSFSFCSSLLPSCVSIRCFSLRALPHLPLPSNSRRSRRRRLGRSSSSPPGGSSFRPAANSRLPLSDDSSNGISYQIVGSGRCSESSARRSFISLGTLAILLPHLQVALGVEHDEASAIRNGLRSVLSKGKAAGMLRLAFHDAGTFDIDGNSGGMNGSIIYELERPENAGLNKSVKILEKTRREIENIRHVSWADLIAVAGAEAVSLCGGPAIPIRLGRIDARFKTTPLADPQGKLPQESLDASGLKSCFQKKGFSAQELVVLSGAHTLGGKGFGNPVVFDNAYFKILLEKPWNSNTGMSSMIGLPSDRALVEDDECLRWIRIYAADQDKFFDDFKNTYIKLVNCGASWKTT